MNNEKKGVDDVCGYNTHGKIRAHKQICVQLPTENIASM